MPPTGPASGSSPAPPATSNKAAVLRTVQNMDRRNRTMTTSDDFKGNVAGTPQNREAKISEQRKRKRVEDWAAIFQEELKCAMKDSGIVNFEVREVSLIATFDVGSSDKNASQKYQVELTYEDAYTDTKQPFAELLPDSSTKLKKKKKTLDEVLEDINVKDIKKAEKQPENKKNQP